MTQIAVVLECDTRQEADEALDDKVMLRMVGASMLAGDVHPWEVTLYVAAPSEGGPWLVLATTNVDPERVCVDTAFGDLQAGMLVDYRSGARVLAVTHLTEGPYEGQVRVELDGGTATGWPTAILTRTLTTRVQV